MMLLKFEKLNQRYPTHRFWKKIHKKLKPMLTWCGHFEFHIVTLCQTSSRDVTSRDVTSFRIDSRPDSQRFSHRVSTESAQSLHRVSTESADEFCTESNVIKRIPRPGRHLFPVLDQITKIPLVIFPVTSRRCAMKNFKVLRRSY